MTASVPPIVWVPFALALLPALPPSTVSARRLALLAVLAAGLTTALAALSFLPALAPRLNGSASLWRDDDMARIMMLCPALCWLLVSIRTLQPGEAVRVQPSRWRRWPIAAQLSAACAMTACRVDLLALLPLLTGGLILLAPRLENDPHPRTSWLAALPLMAIGVAILSMVLGTPARWSTMQAAVQASRQQTVGILLLVAPLLLLTPSALIRPVLAGRSGPLRGMLPMLLLVLTILSALRGCLAATIAPLLLLGGLGWIALSLLLIPACRSLAQRVSLAALLQGGAALVAIASGGAGGIAAAIMLVGFLSLLLPLASSFPTDAASGRLRATSVVVMAGAPPFGPFAAGMVLLVRLFGQNAGLATLLLATLAISALSMLDAARREPRSALGLASGLRLTPWAACAMLVLAVVLWLGLAMPDALSDWLLAIGAERT